LTVFFSFALRSTAGAIANASQEGWLAPLLRDAQHPFLLDLFDNWALAALHD
jgi:hypothetical protein